MLHLSVSNQCSKNELTEMTMWSDKMDGKSSESVDERCGLSERVAVFGCGVIERVKHHTLRWFGHMVGRVFT